MVMAHQVPVTYILALSIAVQAAAAVLAFRLIGITGRRTAWIFIAAAPVLMAVRRVIPLYRLISGDLSILPDPLNEFIGLVLSTSMAVGIALIGRLFPGRKREEQKLREWEECIGRLFENSPVAMLVSSGMDQQVILVSKKFTELFGYTIRDIPDVAHWWPLAYPEEEYREEIKARWSAKVEKAIRDRSEIEPMEATVRCKDGSRRHIEFRFSSIGTRNLVTFVDLTERKRAEQQLSLVNFALDHVHEAAFLIDEQARFLYVNNESCRLLGFSRDELLGMTVADVDPDFPLARWPEHWRDLRASRSLTFEGRHKARDGRIYPVEIGANYFEYNGHGYNLALVRDITERHRMLEAMRASEQMQTLHVMQTPLGVIEWNLDFEVTKWNPAAERIFGYSQSEALGAHASFIVPPGAKDRIDQVWSDLIRRKGGLRSTNENTTKDGRRIYCEWYNTPLVDAGGNVIAVVSMVQDVTDRRKAESDILQLNAELEQRVVRRTEALRRKSEELQESQRALMNIVEDLNLKTGELEQANIKLKELDRLKSMFIASMSHELRTPLNSIIGFSSITLEEWTGPLNDEQKKNLATVLRSGKHLLSLINDVIDVSKIEAGKHEPAVEDFDLYNLITDAAALFRKEIEQKGLELNVESRHLDMRTDRRRLLQCLVNLVSNAVKFTERGRIEIKINFVRSSNVLPEPDIVELVVSDTGIGMKKEDLPKLFSAFTRIPSPLSTKVKGTGLGLYLVKKITTEILKGDVTVHSVPDEGSSFGLQIPIKL